MAFSGLVPAFLLALSSNIDNMGVGVSYGVRRIGIPFLTNLVVGVVSTLGTYVSMTMGSLVARYIPAQLAGTAGSLIIVGAGVWVMIQSWVKTGVTAAPVAVPVQDEREVLHLRIRSLGILIRILKEPSRVDIDYSGRIEGKEAFLLALALTVNNLAGGFGGGMTGLNIPFTVTMVFVLSLFTLASAVQFGYSVLSRWLGKWGGLIAGLILVAVGIYEFFS